MHSYTMLGALLAKVMHIQAKLCDYRELRIDRRFAIGDGKMSES